MTGRLNDTQLSQLAGLNAGRYPLWPAAPGTVVDAAASVPSSLSDGIDVEDEQTALVALDLQEDPSEPSIYVSVSSVADSTLYRITADATNYDYTSDADATEDEILDGLVAAVAAGAGTHSAERVTTGETEEIRVWRADGAIIASPSSSTELEDPVVDATSVEFVVWALPAVPGAAATDARRRWRAIGTASVTATRNYLELWGTSGIERLAVQPITVDGRCRWSIAPCQVTAEDAAG